MAAFGEWEREDGPMSRRCLLYLGAFLSIAMVVTASLWYATKSTHRINEHTSRQIEQGMSLTDVEAIFGAPAGDYSTRMESYVYHVRPDCQPWWHKNPPRIWTSNDVCVRLWFNDDDCVDGWAVCSSYDVDETLWAKVRRLFRP
jgi:hypothetical protein